MAQEVTAEQIQNAKKHVYKVIGVVPLLDVKDHREMLLEMADSFLSLLDTWARDDPDGRLRPPATNRYEVVRRELRREGP